MKIVSTQPSFLLQSQFITLPTSSQCTEVYYCISLMKSDHFSMKRFHKSLYSKNSNLGVCPFSLGRERRRKTNFVDKLISNSVVNHHDSDQSDSVCASAQSKRSYLKFLRVQD
jgi:hypothetical protein